LVAALVALGSCCPDPPAAPGVATIEGACRMTIAVTGMT
jgi:hypothetical protein